MAITKVDVQGITLSAGGALVGCLQAIGNLEETRPVKEYGCLSTNETVKALGSITRGSLEVSVLLDPNATTDGQKTLVDAFASNADVAIVVELNNQITPTTGNGTQYGFTARVSKVSKEFPADEAVMLNLTVEIASAIVITPAV